MIHPKRVCDKRAYRQWLLLLVLWLGLPTLGNAERSLTPAPSGPLILISVDGLHPDALARVKTPAIDQLAAAGATADWLEVVFPSFTFPSHYSLVTGLPPARHGIVANRMRDPDTGRTFSIYNSEEVESSDWWGGEPIWVTAERQGLTAATLFWPGSEAEIAGYRPTYWYKYQHDLIHERRVQQVLSWLDGPKPPHLITLYFSKVDSMGHQHGPESPQLDEALRDMDEHLGDLFSGLAERGLLESAHIVLVSDHGMAAVSEERTVFLDDYIDIDRLKPSLLGPVGFFWPEEDDIEDIIRRLHSVHPNMTLARPDDLPERFKFTGHRRIPPLLALADEGWLISRRGPSRPYADARGAHGYDPRSPSMRAVFMVRGPLLSPNSKIGPVSALDVYPLMAHLLGLAPADHEGDLSVFKAVLKD